MTAEERKYKEAKDRLVKAIEPFIWDSKIEWPQDLTDASDRVNLENQIKWAIEDYEYSHYEVVALVEIMFYKYKHAFDRDTISKYIDLVIESDIPRILTEYFAKELFDYPNS